MKGVGIANGRAYVANGSQGLKIYNLGGNPHPERWHEGRASPRPSRVAATTHRSVVTGAHLPTNTARLLVVDSTDPTLPEVVGELPTTVTAAAASSTWR